MQEEVFKDVPGYEGSYQVSNLGRVKGLDREVSNRAIKGSVLKPDIDKAGYHRSTLTLNMRKKKFRVHQLVAMAFLNHKPCGHKIVVDHKNNDKQDNRLENLQLISSRENSSKDRRGSSKYTGVSWNKQNEKWISCIDVKNKTKHLGYFDSEEQASKYYQDALKSLEEGTEIKVKKPKFSSKYKGVSWNKNRNKWMSSIEINGKQKYLGYFNCELEAHHAYQNELIKLK